MSATGINHPAGKRPITFHVSACAPAQEVRLPTSILPWELAIGANTVVFTLLYGFFCSGAFVMKDAGSLSASGVATPTGDPSRAS